jgi:hypothetical protein
VSPQPRPRGPQDFKGVYKAQITPHWFDNDTRFWYRNDTRGGTKEFILVDAERGTREFAFDHGKLAASLSQVTGAKYLADKLPFDNIEFVENARAIRFKVDATTWKCDLASYQCSKTDAAPSQPPSPEVGTKQSTREQLVRQDSLWPDGLTPAPEELAEVQQPERRREPINWGRSPDEKWTALVKENNVFVRGADGKEIQLSEDGKAGFDYGLLSWSPDSRTLVAFRIEPGERKEVYLIESSPKEGGRAKLRTRPYALPGDKFSSYELNVFDVASR